MKTRSQTSSSNSIGALKAGSGSQTVHHQLDSFAAHGILNFRAMVSFPSRTLEGLGISLLYVASIRPRDSPEYVPISRIVNTAPDSECPLDSPCTSSASTDQSRPSNWTVDRFIPLASFGWHTTRSVSRYVDHRISCVEVPEQRLLLKIHLEEKRYIDPYLLVSRPPTRAHARENNVTSVSRRSILYVMLRNSFYST